MKYLPIIIKILMALPLLVFGLNKLLPTPFIQTPPPEGEIAQMYMQAFFASYLVKTVALVEVIGAILLFLKRTENLALLILFPVSLNILLFHLFHDVGGLFPGAIILLGNTYLLYHNRILQKLLN